MTEEEYDRLLGVNLKGMVFLSKFVIPVMSKNCGGRIVNIASLAGQRGGRFAGIHYSASKAGVLAATKVLAYTGSEMGINVNAVAPGMIATDMAASLNFSSQDIPLKRLGTPDEVADGVVFLVSGMSNYITGFTLDINGGAYMH